MTNCLDLKFGAQARKTIGLLRKVYGQVSFRSFSFTHIGDYAPVLKFLQTLFMKEMES